MTWEAIIDQMQEWVKLYLKGMIVLWSGAVVDIPTGWHLCDGTGGTPDLRNKFVPGAGDTYNPGDTGGSDSQTHTFTGDGHAHSILLAVSIAFGEDYNDYTSTENVTGTTDTADNRPQYYALCYIMKL